MAPWPTVRPSQLSAAQAKGLRYEAQVFAWLSKYRPDAIRGLWLHYEDRTGTRFAQPDIIIKETDHVRLYEVKLTSRCGPSHDQIDRYAGLLEALWGQEVQRIHVYRWSQGAQAGIVGPTSNALQLRSEEVLDWHFLGA